MDAMVRTMREKREPNRRCIVSGAVLPRTALLRFVVADDGTVVPDIGEELPGRGLWLQADGDMIRAACAKGAFAKAARRQVRPPSDLVQQVEQLLRRRCLDLIGLARRSGDLVGGFEKVRAFLAARRAGLLFAASDGAADGRKKISALAPDVPVVDLFDGSELGAAAGRPHMVHAAVVRGRLAERLLHEARRLSGVRGATTEHMTMA